MMKLPHAVVIETPGWARDRYTNKVKDWAVGTSVSTQGFFQPRRGSEDETGENVQIGDGVLYLSPGTVVTGDDRVTVLGDTFEVIGPAEMWDGGESFSALAHRKITLRKIKG